MAWGVVSVVVPGVVFARALSRQMRLYPAVPGILRQWGIATEVNGQARDTVEIFLDLADKLKAEPNPVIGQHNAGLMGLSSSQFVHAQLYASQIRAMRSAGRWASSCQTAKSKGRVSR